MNDQMIQAGMQAPEFALARFQEDPFTHADVQGWTLLVFYPFAFSPVCSRQLPAYDEAVRGGGVTVYGVSCDSTWTQEAFKKALSVGMVQLSDYYPQGETCQAFGVLHPGGFPQRALVLIDPDGVVRWSHQAPSTSDPAPSVDFVLGALYVHGALG